MTKDRIAPSLIRRKPREPIISSTLRKNGLLKAEEVAQILGLAVKTIYNGTAGTDAIARVKVGRSIRFVRSDVEGFLEKLIKEAQKREKSFGR